MTGNLSKTLREAYIYELPVTPYEEALKIQHEILASIHEKKNHNPVVLILEHPSVFTSGRHGGEENLIVSRDFLDARKIPVVNIERGGNITYHGPGQLIVYPIIDLEAEKISVNDYVWGLEEVMIGICDSFNVKTFRNEKNHGIWIENSKIGSVGIALRHGISFHGFALNINPSLEPFSWINPCGLRDIGVTSVEKEYTNSKKNNRTINMQAARKTAVVHLKKVFGFNFETISPCRLTEYL